MQSVRCPNRHATVAARIPRDTEARLEHLHIGRNLPIRREAVGARGVRHRLSDESVEEHILRRGDGIRLLLSIPPEPVVDGKVWCGFPVVLHENGNIVLRNLLRSCVLYAATADSRLLQIELHRA